MADNTEGPGDTGIPSGAPASAIHAQPHFRTFSVVGPVDSRKRVQPTTSTPFCCIAHLLAQFPDGFQDPGSGFLLPNGVIVTAGHCLRNPTHGGLAVNIRVSLARDGSTEPFGFDHVTTPHLRLSMIHQDVGAILLPAGTPRPNAWFGAWNVSNTALQGVAVASAGYPAVLPQGVVGTPGTMWWAGGNVYGLTGNAEFSHTVDTSAGQSGSPVWTVNGGNAWAVGIHIAAVGGINRAARITTALKNEMMIWINQNSPPPSHA